MYNTMIYDYLQLDHDGLMQDKHDFSAFLH